MDNSDDRYRDERARFYDASLEDAGRPDVEFYVDLAREADEPVLETTCGTGRIYLELLEGGVDADGFDLSAAALEVLRENAAERGLEPSVWRADLTSFEPDRRYGLVTCPFNAIQNLTTVGDQLAALQSVHEALAPGGRFVFDVFVPGFDVICETYGEWESREIEYCGETHEVRSRARIADEVEQQFTVETELYDPDGSLVFAEEDLLSMLPKRQVELLARHSPFESHSVTGDFTDEPLSDGHSIQVWSLQKADD
ncbi:class I SAM-dependent methyltransferase [Natronobacterium texcoconense]|uniref:Methyltransferase domain-containing protein n=1 Tax=Natronobacterium texcoconense TaxID=1095778 RepID=A0A1H1HWD1_NATTX|nr:class I SAM-dependent methyltransferase [Natronobacterium texcoconense]SDR29458.1 Methyltransferase domain-containing protein [Natronobacterium texcoconense]